MPDAVTQYRDLRARIDAASGRLVDLHCKHLACGPGCHDCCTDFTVSAVEYRAILEDLRSQGVTAERLGPAVGGAGCAFLTGDGLCGLYRFRPLICRTHGLPVAFEADDEADPTAPPAKSVSFCPKNFTQAEGEDLDFGPENTLDLDDLNVELAAINAEFQRGTTGPGEPPALYRRVPLRQLRDEL